MAYFMTKENIAKYKFSKFATFINGLGLDFNENYQTDKFCNEFFRLYLLGCIR